MIQISFRDLDRIAEKIKHKGITFEEALFVVASQVDKDIRDGLDVEEFKDIDSDREITIELSAYGRRNK